MHQPVCRSNINRYSTNTFKRLNIKLKTEIQPIFAAMKKHTIKLRYNNDCKDNRLYWRVLIDGVEHLAENVEIKIATSTTEDFLPEKRVTKHHISCESDSLVWEGDVLTIS